MRRRITGPRLLIFRGERLTVAPAPFERLIIGRHPRCHLRIKNPDVNLKHAVIERVGTTTSFRLIDFGATIPTLVNGEARGSCDLELGDQIEIAGLFVYLDRVRKDAPEEHQTAFANLQEMETQSRGLKPPGEVAGEGGGERAPFDPAKLMKRGRRRRRTTLKSTFRRRRDLPGGGGEPA